MYWPISFQTTISSQEHLCRPMRDLIDAPGLAAFANNENSTFTVRSADDAELVLDTVDTPHNTREDWERFSLLLRGPANNPVESGIHRVDHPRLDAFDMNLRPVQTMDPDPETMHYQASFNRHVPDREPSRPYTEPKEKNTSRRGFFGTLAAALGGAGLVGSLFGSGTARAESGEERLGPTSNHYIGEIITAGFNYAPPGWALCDGQLLPIQQNQALFTLLQTQFGGDGLTSVGLPDLRGRVPIHQGQGDGLSRRRMGDAGGQEKVTLDSDQIPSHSHDSSLPVSTDEADATTPDGNTLGVQPNSRGTVPLYNDTGNRDGSIAVDSSPVGGGRSHNNMPPFQTVNYLIALSGVYPPRN